MSIELNIKSIQTAIADCLTELHDSAKTVTVMAVSKKQSVDAIRHAYAAGIRDFGENYLQEAQEKMARLPDLPICWHMIGDIQSNKARATAEQFSWVHSVSRLKIAELLNQHRPQELPPLNICIAVNVDDEKSKSGVLFSEILPLAKEIQKLPRLRLRGLMCIPEPGKSAEAFQQLAQYQQELIAAGICVDTLSMGMSDDYLHAIKAGATIVRIGTGIFGARM